MLVVSLSAPRAAVCPGNCEGAGILLLGPRGQIARGFFVVERWIVAQDPTHFAGDHQVFAGVDDGYPHPRVPGGDVTFGTDAVVEAGVQSQAEKGEVGAHVGAQSGGVLADAGGEHERVEAAQLRGQGAHRRADPVLVDLQGEARPAVPPAGGAFHGPSSSLLSGYISE